MCNGQAINIYGSVVLSAKYNYVGSILFTNVPLK